MGGAPHPLACQTFFLHTLLINGIISFDIKFGCLGLGLLGSEIITIVS